MKIEQKTIYCDTCKKVLYHELDGKKDNFLSNLITEITIKRGEKSKSGIYCSLQCMVIDAWDYVCSRERRVDKELAEDLSIAFPDWQFIPPNYKKINEEKSLKQVDELMEQKGLDNYQVIKKELKKEKSDNYIKEDSK